MMDGGEIIGLIAVVLIFGTPVIGIICWTLTVAFKKKQSTQAQDPEETKIIQEIHHGLSRMEKRIESLETIMFDQKQKDG